MTDYQFISQCCTFLRLSADTIDLLDANDFMVEDEAMVRYARGRKQSYVSMRIDSEAVIIIKKDKYGKNAQAEVYGKPTDKSVAKAVEAFLELVFVKKSKKNGKRSA